MSYTQQDVEEGRALVKREGECKWQLGDLALKVAPMGSSTGPNDGANEKLEEFANQIGIEFNTLREYRAVAAAWPLDARASNTSWTAHRALRGYGTVEERQALLARLVAEGRATYRGVRVALDLPVVDDYPTAPHHRDEALVVEAPRPVPPSVEDIKEASRRNPDLIPEILKDDRVRTDALRNPEARALVRETLDRHPLPHQQGEIAQAEERLRARRAKEAAHAEEVARQGAAPITKFALDVMGGAKFLADLLRDANEQDVEISDQLFDGLVDTVRTLVFELTVYAFKHNKPEPNFSTIPDGIGGQA